MQRHGRKPKSSPRSLQQAAQAKGSSILDAGYTPILGAKTGGMSSPARPSHWQHSQA